MPSAEILKFAETGDNFTDVGVGVEVGDGGVVAVVVGEGVLKEVGCFVDVVQPVTVIRKIKYPEKN